MASEVLRRYVHDLYLASPKLAELGLGADTILPTFSPDGPVGNRFLVMRWGTTTPGIGNVNQVRLSCWVYNREPDFAPIVAALKEVKRLLAGMEAVVMAPGESVLAVRFEGDSDDLFDDGYRAHTRWTSHTITASGS